MSLCEKARTVAPESRTPSTMDRWFSLSLSTSTPAPPALASKSAGKTAEFVAKPIPSTMASSLFKYSAICFSSSRWTGMVPPSVRVPPAEKPLSRAAALAAGVQNSSTPPKPR